MNINLPKSNNQKGFTLIELLVVVVVISALSGIVVSMINSGGFRDKAKDAQRVAHLKQVQTALELYFSDYRQYPNSGSGAWIQITGSDNLSNALGTGYLNKIPIDPEQAGTDNSPCANVENHRYNYMSDGSYYLLTAIMAVESSKDESPCADLNAWGSNCSGGSTATHCYGVENP